MNSKIVQRNSLAVAAGIALIVLLWLLAKTLIPFVIGAYLAYLGNPLVHALMRYGLSRTMAVIVVFILLILVVTGVGIILIPLISHEIDQFIQQVPALLDWYNVSIQPYLNQWLPENQTIDLPTVKIWLKQNWHQSKLVAGNIWHLVANSSSTILVLLSNLLLILVITFYFLRDWEHLVQTQTWINNIRTSKWYAFIQEIDQVIRSFLRGQLGVMLILAILYSIGLHLIGLSLSVLVGVITGLLTIVPLLGLLVGLLLSSLLALLQFHDLIHVGYVILLFGVLAIFENIVLVPRLVGESLGLHPVTVIFAVLACGQLLGGFGVLLALPIAATVKVALRHLSAYLNEEKKIENIANNPNE